MIILFCEVFMKLNIIILTVIIISTVCCGKKNDPSIDKPILIRIPKNQISDEFIEKYKFIPDHVHDDRYAFGYITYEESSEFSTKEIDIVDPNSIHYQLDPKNLAYKRNDIDPDKIQEGYHDYNQLTNKLETLAAAPPNLTSLESAGKSVENRELWYMRINNKEKNLLSKPKILYIANMHGDEVVGRELSLKLIESLINDYPINPRIRNLVDHSDIFIMPSMNPDGFENRSRFNKNYKDLNRNFPDFVTDPKDSPDNREPETQAIMRLHDEHHFLLTINFHGGALCFNLPWDTIANKISQKFADDKIISELAREYVTTNVPMSKVNGGSFDRGVTYGYEWYEIDGSLQDWSNFYRGSIHGTVELSRVKWPPAYQLEQFWQNNRESMIHFLERGSIGAHLAIKSIEGQLIQGRPIQISSSGRKLIYKTPLIHRPLPLNKQQITVEVPGFISKTFVTEGETFRGYYKDIILTRKTSYTDLTHKENSNIFN